jgi:glutamate dehydrogenase/leucine dehydrogenase
MWAVFCTLKKQGRAVKDYGRGTEIENRDLLRLPVDVLVPAALENVLTAENATEVKATVILELANGPTTLEEDRIFSAKNRLVVPDILANVGGVVVSYFEWDQNLKGEKWRIGRVRQRLAETMSAAWEDVLDGARRHNTTLRSATYAVALRRLARAMPSKTGRSSREG